MVSNIDFSMQALRAGKKKFSRRRRVRHRSVSLYIPAFTFRFSGSLECTTVCKLLKFVSQCQFFKPEFSKFTVNSGEKKDKRAK
mmetsp:Transcript_32868/g.64458  ORF Transcript_32868/g.64458 Transcript_32868/m.64458 type:complete len:84 (-) Transcript_32868:49-300(-)